MYPKNSSFRLSEHFTAREFDCPCKDPKCTETFVSQELVDKLEKLRKLTGPLTVTSGYRCRYYQEDLERRGYETAKNSQHLLGKAADVTTKKMGGAALEGIARMCGFKAVGVGKTFIHVDLRSDKDRVWSYTR
jgi:zinc D-Ala-D-Ala carboxypeptidase